MYSSVIMWVIVLMAVVAQVRGHGMVMDPVSRSSMWRMGFHTPVNYDDDGNFCGGFSTQWEEHAGKCGECGDDYGLPRPRPNENTGKYGKGIIVKTLKSGQEFVAYIDVTTNHQGFFEFRLCPLQSRDELETEECFSKFLLQQPDGSTKYYILNHEEGYSGYFNATTGARVTTGPRGMDVAHRRLSERVPILPSIEQQLIYIQFSLDRDNASWTLVMARPFKSS
uniref:Chitin-binding type-4 domain-containing protein n=1 Tax=Timema poppense TaxID=170557 RepID=A0A7R9H2G3_TIMPO|nr:unnamed protein product [Timema poppensis]